MWHPDAEQLCLQSLAACKCTLIAQSLGLRLGAQRKDLSSNSASRQRMRSVIFLISNTLSYFLRSGKGSKDRIEIVKCLGGALLDQFLVVHL